MSAPELLRIRGLSYSWDGTPVVRDVTLGLSPGEFLVLLGPNGSGKTTLLRLIAGLERPDAGEIALSGAPLDGVPTHRRGIGMLSQDAELFPNRTVGENIAYGPQVQHRPDREVAATVSELAQLLRLGPLLDRRPNELSGGERQRAALARCLAPRPGLVLLDEPFASVDPEIRRELRAEFRRVLRERRTATVFVTHDRDEGLFLGDRIAVLLAGTLRQLGTPREVMDHPYDREVARFLGYNVISEGGRTLAVAPSDIVLGGSGPEGTEARVTALGWSPNGVAVLLRGPDGETWEAVVPEPPSGLAVGGRVHLAWRHAVSVATHDGRRS